MANMDQNAARWTSWIGFAAIMMMISGIAHIVYGLASLFNQVWFLYLNERIYIFDPTSGGWLLALIGVLFIVSGALLFSGNMVGRIMGAALAMFGILSNLAYIGIAPLWSVIGISINAIVLYAIGRYGGRNEAEG